MRRTMVGMLTVIAAVLAADVASAHVTMRGFERRHAYHQARIRAAWRKAHLGARQRMRQEARQGRGMEWWMYRDTQGAWREHRASERLRKNENRVLRRPRSNRWY